MLLRVGGYCWLLLAIKLQRQKEIAPPCLTALQLQSNIFGRIFNGWKNQNHEQSPYDHHSLAFIKIFIIIYIHHHDHYHHLHGHDHHDDDPDPDHDPDDDDHDHDVRGSSR